MASEKFANRPEALVDSSFSAGGTSLTVDDASDFPTTGVFRVVLGNAEGTIFRVDSVAGDVFTGAVEAFDGNASVGDTVKIVASKAVAERFLQSPESGEARATAGVSAADFYGPIWKLTALDQSSWSWVNQGSASVTQASGIVYLLTPGAAGSNVRGRFVASPATPYTITAAVLPGLTGGTHNFCGICFREASSSKLYDIHVYNAGGATTEQVRVQKWTNSTTASTTMTTRGMVANRGPVWLRISDNGTNLIFSYSIDGVNWFTLNTEARGTFMSGGSGPTQVGIDISSEDTSTVGGTAMSVLSWLQS